MKQPTPRPWTGGLNTENQQAFIISEKTGEIVATMSGNWKHPGMTNAMLIIDSVNAVEYLVGALNAMVSLLIEEDKSKTFLPELRTKCLAQAYSAIQKIDGGLQ